MTRISKKFAFVAAAVVAATLLAFAAGRGWLLLRQSSVVRAYEAQGFQMVNGCNGSAAVGADFQVYTIQQRLEEFAKSPVRDTNLIVRLQSALVIAQEKAQVLSGDCRRRGHRENHPWKTNWATINQALTAPAVAW